MTMREYDREVMRRLWRRRLRAAGEFVGGVAAAGLFALLAWAFVWLTPPQGSAECEFWAEQMGLAEGGAK